MTLSCYTQMYNALLLTLFRIIFKNFFSVTLSNKAMMEGDILSRLNPFLIFLSFTLKAYSVEIQTLFFINPEHPFLVWIIFLNRLINQSKFRRVILIFIGSRGEVDKMINMRWLARLVEGQVKSYVEIDASKIKKTSLNEDYTRWESGIFLKSLFRELYLQISVKVTFGCHGS